MAIIKNKGVIMNKILAVDGNSILYRAFYGVRPLTNSSGFPTSAIYGFFNMLFREISVSNPTTTVIAFDLPTKTFRSDIFIDYKAHRTPPPDELRQQKPVIMELLTKLGYCVVTKEGFEADDILGTIAKNAEKEGDSCVIFTGDRDSFQLVSETTSVHLCSNKETKGYIEVDPAYVLAEYSVTPSQLIDVKALMGDTSDNIPGVKKIGPKTACALISKYHSIENLYSDIDALETTPRNKTLLTEGREDAFMSYKLAKIDTEVDLSEEMCDFKNLPIDLVGAKEMLRNLEINSILKKVDELFSGNTRTAAAATIAKPEIKPLPVLELLDKKLSGDIALIIEEEILLCDGETIYKAPLDNLCDILKNGEINIISTDAKEVYKTALREGIDINIAFCNNLAGYLCYPDKESYKTENLAEMLGIAMPQDEQSAAVVFSIYKMLKSICEENKTILLLREIELPLALVLASMETLGIELDKFGVERFGVSIKIRLQNMESEIYRQAEGEFNIGSPKQLSEILFTKLKLPPQKKTKTGYSTNNEVLLSLRGEHPIIPLIIEYRALSKLASTYIESLTESVSADGRIHSTFQQTVTRTGRLSSTEPNLQNIPVRTELGREIRKFFVAKEGYTFVDADYSQIELRVLASLSGDKMMTKAFNEDRDIHRQTAAEIFSVAEDMVSDDMRRAAKTVNFGILYGMGAYSLANDLEVPYYEAKGYIENYLNTYSGIAAFMDKTVEQARSDGYVTTMFSRIRPIAEIQSTNKAIAAIGERIAKNTPIQGTAADIIKIAMIAVYNRLKKENLDAKLVLQIHDELIIECREEIADTVARVLTEEMENCVSLNVALKAEAKIGKSWYDAK